MKTTVTQRSPCYSAVSALLVNSLSDHSNYSPLCHTHYWLRINTSLVSSGQTLYQATSWRQSSLLQRFTAESSRELSALRKLNNKQRQVSMFLILLFKLLSQLPIVSFLFSLLPFSILSSPSPPSLLSLLINSLASSDKDLQFHYILFHQWHIFLHSVSHHDIFLIMHSISL